ESEVVRDRLVDLGRIPVVGHDELAGERPAGGAPGPRMERNDLGDRRSGPADDDLFAALDPVDDPGQVGLRIVDVELWSSGFARHRPSLANRLVHLRRLCHPARTGVRSRGAANDRSLVHGAACPRPRGKTAREEWAAWNAK